MTGCGSIHADVSVPETFGIYLTMFYAGYIYTHPISCTKLYLTIHSYYLVSYMTVILRPSQ